MSVLLVALVLALVVAPVVLVWVVLLDYLALVFLRRAAAIRRGALAPGEVPHADG